MIKESIQKIIDKENLKLDEAYQVMNLIMSGKVNNSQIAALLIALKMKGESPEEYAGFIKAMREKSIKINAPENTIDVCGTGGDNSNSFNISTAVAFVVSGAGVNVAKHGNRSISSKCGSSDVLSELGVNINFSREQSEQVLNEIGITFLFAPNYHPAMKYVMPVRKELGMKTIFNVLGPLTNPASTKRQLVGVFNNQTAKLMRDAAKNINMDKVCFICTENSFDEITLTGTTQVYELNSNVEKEFQINNKTFGFDEIKFQDIEGGDSKENAKILLDIFEGKEKGAKKNVVVANAALALYSANYSSQLNKCKQAAIESIENGKALEKLNELIKFSNSFA